MKMLDALAKVSRETLRRFDAGWANDVTGFGTTRDKTTYTAFGGVAYLSDQQVANLYDGDDIAARMVDIVPDEMLREGFEVDLGDAGKNTELAEQLEALGCVEKFANGTRWGRLFGGGALLIGADDGRSASSPLVPEKSRGVSYLYELDRRYLQPFTWYTEPGHPRLGQPETYLVSPVNYQGSQDMTVVHESRLIMFGGATTGLQERVINNGWDRSVLQRAFEALRGFNTGWKAVEVLLTDANQAVFKMQGLAEAIAADGQDAMQKRMQVMDLCRSVMRAIVVDAGDAEAGSGSEEFARHSVSFDSIPQTLDKFMLRLAAAVQIPATILYGQSPAGMSATGDADFRWFYDRIRAQQRLTLAPKIRRLVRVMMHTKGSVIDSDSITVKFPSLWSETPLNESTRRKTIAETDAIYVNAGVVTAEEIALSRFKPEGFSEDLVLTDEAVAARESSLSDELERLENGDGMTAGDREQDTDFGAPPAPPRFDSSDILDQLTGHRRIVVAGVPRAGKTTLSARASERFKIALKSSDSLIEENSWGSDSDRVSEWLDAPGDWIIEGVAAPRALRKWLAANPDRALDAAVVWMGSPQAKQNKGQAAMGKACSTVWREVLPELNRRGVKVIG